ncbi:MAG: HEPN domain-containing protein [Ignavibacteria bacterium]
MGQLLSRQWKKEKYFMPPDNLTLATSWLKRAKSNLIRAKLPRQDEVFLEDLCYDTQQSVEKALKALLIFYKIKFRYVHDIGELLRTLNENGISYPEDFKDAVLLTDYAVETRYPVLSEPVTESEYLEAVRIADLVFRWVEEKLNPQFKLDI